MAMQRLLCWIERKPDGELQRFEQRVTVDDAGNIEPDGDAYTIEDSHVEEHSRLGLNDYAGNIDPSFEGGVILATFLGGTQWGKATS